MRGGEPKRLKRCNAHPAVVQATANKSAQAQMASDRTAGPRVAIRPASPEALSRWKQSPDDRHDSR
jgi:hypothetical protein